MEYDETAARVQGILLNNKRTEGPLNTITYDGKVNFFVRQTNDLEDFF